MSGPVLKESYKDWGGFNLYFVNTWSRESRIRAKADEYIPLCNVMLCVNGPQRCSLVANFVGLCRSTCTVTVPTRASSRAEHARCKDDSERKEIPVLVWEDSLEVGASLNQRMCGGSWPRISSTFCLLPETPVTCLIDTNDSKQDQRDCSALTERPDRSAQRRVQSRLPSTFH